MKPKNSKQKKTFTYQSVNPILDVTNLQILKELQYNPRLTVSELARRVKMSSPTVTERVRRLEEAGVIRGYKLDINPAALGLPITIFVRVRPSPGQLHKVAALAESTEEVLECHRITGEDCFLLKVCIPSIDQLDRLLDRFLLYGSTTTSILQSSPVPPRNPPLPKIERIHL
jgi:Lrp/AsnC family transcriptional regulator, leucine-responsive regulatory protein